MKSIFISSTFKDMQAERDILHQRVFPKLRKRLAAYGEDVQELDLRWGVDTSRMSEEESGKFVIEACIDSIDRCKPYMVVLLGSRYGWIPERKVVEDTGNDRIMTWCGEEASITQMEILYGALSKKDLDKCVFCFRNENFPDSVPEGLRQTYASESPRHREKLAKLKAEICGREQAVILNYEAAWDMEKQSAVGLERFEEQLTEALWKMISRDLDGCAGEKSVGEQILQDSKLTAERYLTTYVSRRIDQQDGPMALIGRRGYWFTGEGGSGKSAMMAQIAAQGRKVGAKVFLYFGGNEGCGSVDTLLSTLLDWLDRIDGKRPRGYSSMHRETVRLYLHDRLRVKRDFDWAVLVDGVDQMEEDAVQTLCWMARRMIREEKEKYWHGLAASSTKDFAARWSAELEGSFVLRPLEPLTSMELNAVVQSHAARRGKKLDANVVQCIRNKKGARNPYYLSLLLQKLFMMDQRDFEQAEALAPGMEGLSRYMCRELAALPEDTGAVTVAVLRSAAEKLAARMEQLPLEEGALANPMEVLELLAAAKGGMTLEELAEVLAEQGKTFPPMFMEQMFCYLYDSFGESDGGVWNFKHRLLREGLVSHMGAEEYKRNCAILLRHYENKTGASADRLYYAWQVGDVSAGLRCLTAEKEEWREIVGLFRQMLAQGGERYLTALSGKADGRQAESLLGLLRDVGEAALPWEPQIRPWLSKLAPGEDAPPALRFRYDLVEIAFRIWDLDPQSFGKIWRQTAADFGKIQPLDKSKCLTMYFECKHVLRMGRSHGLWKETAAVLEMVRTACLAAGWNNDAVFEGLEETCQWCALAAKGEDLGSGEKAAFCQSLKEFLDKLPATFSSSAQLPWKAYLAGLLIENGQYSGGNGILKEILPSLEFQYSFSGSLEGARSYVQGLLDKAAALQAKYAVSYLRQAQEICKAALEKGPFAYWQYLLGSTEIRLWKALEKSADENHQLDAPRCLDEAVRDLDKLVEAVGAENIPEDILLDILDQRYQRVLRRRKAPNPWQYLEQQKADFRYMEAQYTALDARSRYYQAFSDMCWGLMEEVRYFDICHLEQDMIAAGNKLLRGAKAMAELKLPSLIWNGLGAQLELAEILFRYHYIKAAASLTDQAYETIQRVDANWVAQRKKTVEYCRRTVRFYLMKARLALRQKGDVQTGTAYINLASKALGGKEGEQEPLPASDNILRSEMWVLFGELLLQAEKDSEVPDVLDSTDRYWKKETLAPILRGGGTREERAALLRYCRGLALRARLRKEPKYMDRAVEYLRDLTGVYTRNRDASTWEELYDALMDACKYYWTLRQGDLLPENLMTAMLPALARKAEEGSLTENEQILFGQTGLEKESCLVLRGLGTGYLPETAWLRLVLDQEKALEQPSSQNRAAARLAVDFALRGDYTAALAAASEGNPAGNGDSVRLLCILADAVQSIAGKKAPEKALTPQALAWLETPLASREAFIRVYLETLCGLADSFGTGPDALESGRRSLKLLQERAEKLGKDVSKTVIPHWTFSLAERLAAAKEAGADIPLEEYIQILRAEDSAGREIYDAGEDPGKKGQLLMRTGAVDLKLAEAYRAAGDKAKCNSYILGALWQTIRLKKDMNRQDWCELTQWYELARQSRDTLKDPKEFRQRQWMELMYCGERICQGRYQEEKDPAWMERLAAEAALYRARLLEVEQESVSWRQQKAADAWDCDREAWLTLLRDRPTERVWLARYLDAARNQIEALGEGQEKKLEEILDELYSLETVTTEEEAAVDRVIDLAAAGRRGGENDIMYLMYQALRDLGEEAQMEQVRAYIKARRAGGIAALGQ